LRPRRRTPRPAFPAEQAHSQTKSRLLRSIVWALTVVILMSVLGCYASNSSARQTRAPARSGPAPAATSTIPDKSIAVLPFVDMSEKKDQNISQMAWEDDGGTTSS
jgi:hypothetical protein